MQDSQSKRSFFDKPINLDHIGHARFPHKLESPIMLLPNSNTEFTLYNNNVTDTYVAIITFMGYRVRVEDQQLLLGLVTK
jgi:hypothetical protein